MMDDLPQVNKNRNVGGDRRNQKKPKGRHRLHIIDAENSDWDYGTTKSHHNQYQDEESYRRRNEDNSRKKTKDSPPVRWKNKGRTRLPFYESSSSDESSVFSSCTDTEGKDWSQSETSSARDLQSRNFYKQREHNHRGQNVGFDVESVETGGTNTVMSSVTEFQTIDSRIVHNQRRSRHGKKERTTHPNIGLPPLPPSGQEKKGILKSNVGKKIQDASDRSRTNMKAPPKKEQRFMHSNPPIPKDHNHDFGGRLNGHTELPSERRKQTQLQVSRRAHSFDGVLDPEYETIDQRKLQKSIKEPSHYRKLSENVVHRDQSRGEYITRDEGADGQRNDKSAFTGREPPANSEYLDSNRPPYHTSNEKPHTINSNKETKSSNIPRKPWSKSRASASVSLYSFNNARYEKESRLQNQSSFDGDSELMVDLSPSYATEHMERKPKKAWRVQQRDTITRVASDQSSTADYSTGESIVSVDRKFRKSRVRVRNPSREPMSVC